MLLSTAATSWHLSSLVLQLVTTGEFCTKRKHSIITFLPKKRSLKSYKLISNLSISPISIINPFNASFSKLLLFEGFSAILV